MFIVTVSVIHRRLCSSTNYNSTRCHIPTPPPSVYIVTQSAYVTDPGQGRTGHVLQSIKPLDHDRRIGAR